VAATDSGRGRLVVMEGVDGSGKSTVARRLAESLGALLTFEPGDSALGRALRAMLLESDAPGFSPRTEALLMSADRAQHVAEVVAPALQAGGWVVSDRYAPSTLAYQGYGRGLDLAELTRLVAFATEGVQPDLIVLLDVPVEQALARRRGVEPDRLEGLDTAFHERVRRGYLTMAAADREHWAVVDGSVPLDEVLHKVESLVTERVGRPASAP